MRWLYDESGVGWGVTGVEEFKLWVDVETADSGRAAEQRFVWGCCFMWVAGRGIAS